MWLDLLAGIILALFVTMGAIRGALTTGMGLLSLAVAYTAAVLFAPDLGAAIAAQLDLPELVAVPLGGTLAFVAAYGAMSLLSIVVGRLAADPDGTRSARDRFLGGVFGAVRGVMIVLLVSWLALWVDALRATGTVDGIPEIGGSAAAAFTGEVVESGLEAALGDAPGGRVMARMASRPGASIVEFQSILEDPHVDALRNDAAFWTYVEHGSVDAALNRMAFQRILGDRPLRERFATLGLVSDEAAADPRVFREAIAEVFREVGPRIRGLRNDPELQQLVEDPQVVAMIEDGDTIGLLRHRGFRSLVDRITSQPLPE